MGGKKKGKGGAKKKKGGGGEFEPNDMEKGFLLQAEKEALTAKFIRESEEADRMKASEGEKRVREM